MTMRWVHTWKVAEDTGETKAKARLVVEGFTDPDLAEIRSDLRSVEFLETTHSTHRFFARLRLRKGDVKPAFLSGRREEPPQELRDKLQIARQQVLKLEIAVLGLRNAPRALCSQLDGFSTRWISVH